MKKRKNKHYHLYKAARDRYNDRQIHSNSPSGYTASIDSDKEFLDRISVNYLLHECCGEYSLEVLKDIKSEFPLLAKEVDERIEEEDWDYREWLQEEGQQTEYLTRDVWLDLKDVYYEMYSDYCDSTGLKPVTINEYLEDLDNYRSDLGMHYESRLQELRGSMSAEESAVWDYLAKSGGVLPQSVTE